MDEITICVADNEECKQNCKRRCIKPNPYSQSYANFSLDYMDNKGNCQAFIGFGKKFKITKLKIN